MKRISAIVVALFAGSVAAGQPGVAVDHGLQQRVEQLLQKLEAATADPGNVAAASAVGGKFTVKITVPRPSLAYKTPVDCQVLIAHTGVGASYYETASAPLVWTNATSLTADCTLSLNYQWPAANPAGSVAVETALTGAGLQIGGGRYSEHALPVIPVPANGANTILNYAMKMP